MEADSAAWGIRRQAEGLSQATEKPRAYFTVGLDQSKGLSALEKARNIRSLTPQGSQRQDIKKMFSVSVS